MGNLLKGESKVFKPFSYEWAFEAYRTHESLHWMATEIPLADDVKDYAKADEREKKFIEEVMKLFTTNDIAASQGYTGLLRIFKPTEVIMMLSSFAAREACHIDAYSLFTETLGFGDEIYKKFLDIPEMNIKTEYLDKAKVRKYEDYKAVGLSDVEVDKRFRRDVARMLAVYGGCLEGIELFAQFAMLLKYQFDNKYKGLCQIVDYSIKDEAQHQINNSKLFRTFIAENPDIWDDDLKFDIYQAVREVVAQEEVLIDYLNPPHIDNEVCKQYIRYQADNALKLLGMKANYGIESNPLPYMDEVTAGVSLVNFFEQRVTDYAKGALTGSWDKLKEKR